MALSRSLLKKASSFIQVRSYARLLDSYKISPGEVIIQNEADSVVGRSVISEAKQLGIKTINVISDKPGTPDLVEELKQLGGDIVITESYANTWYLKRLLSDVPSPSLGINFSQGYQTTLLAKLLKTGGTLVSEKTLPKHVTYPGQKRKPILWQDLIKSKQISVKAN